MSEQMTPEEHAIVENPEEPPDDWYYEVPDGLCPYCYRDGEEYELEMEEVSQYDVCPNCGYYE